MSSVRKVLYYDVQVAENEFDIVENCKVADVLATGPEGVHQLNVDRLANGKEWEIGGGDPLCLNPDGTVKVSYVSKAFAGGIVLPDGGAGSPQSLVFRGKKTDGTDYEVTVTLT